MPYGETPKVALPWGESMIIVLMGDFNFLDKCWKSNAAKHQMVNRFLTWVEDFLFNKVEALTKGFPI